MERAFDIIDHTADIGIIAYGSNMKQLFSNAALALFSLITEPEYIKQDLRRDLEITSSDRDSLLAEWLNEFIYLFDAEHILFNSFDIRSLSNTQISASCYGERFDASRHQIKMGVKAATYHLLRIERDDNGYKAQVIFDV